MLKAAVSRTITAALTSPTLRTARRGLRAWQRRLRGDRPIIHYFHDSTDPYSQLTAQMLPALASRYDIALHSHLVPPPDEAAAPDAARLAAWSQRDAAILARACGLQFPCPTAAQNVSVCAQETAAGGAALRAKLGHYLGATFYFEGEWYWGVGRLHYLEHRLAALGLDRRPQEALLAPAKDITLSGPAGTAAGRVLHAFISLRSPYSYIAIPRAQELAAHYGATLRLRFVLPMVMRGLAVPRAKRIYIMLDTKREAETLGMRFGHVVDPVGPGVERGLAVLHHALQAGMGEAFALSFLQGVFADGIDAASDNGLYKIAQRAGMTPVAVDVALADPAWRDEAAANRAELLQAGLWGVPCFRVDDGPMFWGQDRLWVIEEMLRSR